MMVFKTCPQILFLLRGKFFVSSLWIWVEFVRALTNHTGEAPCVSLEAGSPFWRSWFWGIPVATVS